VIAPLTSDEVKDFTVISEGCANSNYKITFTGNKPAVLLRIYVRDADALQREVYVHKLVEGHVPIPSILYHNDSCTLIPYPYAITEWGEGMLMRQLIIEGNTIAMAECLFEAGIYLSQLRKIKFDKGGFFQKEGNIRPFNNDEQYATYLSMLLDEKVVAQSLGHDLLNATKKLVQCNLHYIPNPNDANLTHGDYDPANIIVQKTNNTWKIAGIIDWEFAFSATYLLDAGMMLRYSHKLPSIYEEKFVEGYQHSGHKLPKEWKKSAKMMDLICLLQLIHTTHEINAQT